MSIRSSTGIGGGERFVLVVTLTVEPVVYDGPGAASPDLIGRVGAVFAVPNATEINQ